MTKKHDGKGETNAEREARLDQEALAESARLDAEEAARVAAAGPPTFLERAYANHKAICDHANGTEARAFLAASILTAAEAICERLDVVAGSVNELTFTLGEIRRVFRGRRTASGGAGSTRPRRRPSGMRGAQPGGIPGC